jgi:two-component system LytT family response regulator
MKNTLIPVEDVLWFKSENHYSYVCTKEFEYIYTEPLKDLIGKLNPDQFMQVHRNAIVNSQYIKDIIQGDNMKLVLENGAEVNVSRSNKKIIKERILQH